MNDVIFPECSATVARKERKETQVELMVWDVNQCNKLKEMGTCQGSVSIIQTKTS